MAAPMVAAGAPRRAGRGTGSRPGSSRAPTRRRARRRRVAALTRFWNDQQADPARRPRSSRSSPSGSGATGCGADAIGSIAMPTARCAIVDYKSSDVRDPATASRRVARVAPAGDLRTGLGGAARRPARRPGPPLPRVGEGASASASPSAAGQGARRQIATAADGDSAGTVRGQSRRPCDAATARSATICPDALR